MTTIPITMKEAMAQNILFSAIWHKENCTGDCNVSLYLLGETYQGLKERPLTDDERKIFV